MLMVAEMTGSVSILAPGMVAVGLAWFIVRRGDDTIYRSQLKSRADAPAQRLLVGMPLLANVPVHQAMAPPRLVLQGDTSVLAARRQIEKVGVPGVPVVDDEGRFEGAASLEDLNQLGEEAGAHTIDAVVDASAPTVSGSAHLDVALDALTTASQHWIPVLDNERTVIGTIAMSDIVRGYRLGLLASLRQLDGTDNPDTHDVEIAVRSSLVNLPLRLAGLPVGVIVTWVQRGPDLLVPGGDTVLKAGDRLVVIGGPEGIDVLRAIASGSSQRPSTQNDR
jgi:chloride channel protein, CIC family